MLKLRGLVIACSVAAASNGLAKAADLPPAPTLPPESAPVAQFGGWYLRGDVGFGMASESPGLQQIPDPIATGISRGVLSGAARESFNSALSSSGMIDFGLGYQFNEWVRLDGTVEYRGGASLRSFHTLADSASFFGAPAQVADFYRANVSSFVGLINGYVNLGSWWGASPFIGAGVGLAENNLFGFACQSAGFGEVGSSGGCFSNGTRTNFAWALMAGLDVSITPNLKLEFGYRHLDYGGIATGGSSCLAGSIGEAFKNLNCAGGVTSVISSRNRLASNDLRVGVVWLIGDPTTAPSPPP